MTAHPAKGLGPEAISIFLEAIFLDLNFAILLVLAWILMHHPIKALQGFFINWGSWLICMLIAWLEGLLDFLQTTDDPRLQSFKQLSAPILITFLSGLAGIVFLWICAAIWVAAQMSIELLSRDEKERHGARVFLLTSLGFFTAVAAGRRGYVILTDSS